MKGESNGHECPTLRGIRGMDGSLVGLDDFPGEGQADAHSAFPFREERFPETVEGLGTESGSGIMDCKLRMSVLGFDTGLDSSSIRHGLACVDDKVPDDLFDPELVAGDQGRTVCLDFEV